jgi:hypothetical protein
MKLIQVLLPTYDNDGGPFDPELFGEVRRELTDRFGGLTVFSRAPAEGLWRSDGGTQHDDIVVFEVMAEAVDRGWWAAYRADLERRFNQDVVIVRAQDIETL